MVIKVQWFGHSGFRLDIEGKTVLVDPFLTGNPLASIDPATLPADFILLTHVHGDHLGDSEAIAKRTGATVIGVAEVAGWFSARGIKGHGQNTGGGYQHPFGHVKFVRADHSSSFPDGSYGGVACGIVLTVKDKKLYFAGDTALFSDMKLIGDLGIDTAFLPIGDNFTMGPDDSIQAIQWIRPKRVVPIHYNTWGLLAQDAVAWAQRVQNDTDAQPIVLDPGGTFTIDVQ
ncbi:MAG: metal-dependent hydrolase [Anaerolineae bacterium]|nr:metal-dependent hydrolase [Anaerolineae bacterium]